MSALTTLDDLHRAGLIRPSAVGNLQAVAARYAVAVTPAVAAMIDRADPADPIARQFVPDVRELDFHHAETADPIGDHGKTVVPGLVHRYRDRALLKVSGVCPVYCRFCFRREMIGPGAGTTLSTPEIAAALAYIQAHPAIWEVILTGGDPLILSPRRIQDLTRALGAIAHVKVLRWHTRVPVVTPERVTPDLVAALTATGQTVYVAIHANHARELTQQARAGLLRMAQAGIGLVSQTVLLAGVNDDVATLEALMRAFVEARVVPYYLHHGDLAPGTAQFRTTIARGQEIMRELRARLSGLAQPTYVLDVPGASGKVPIGAGNVTLISRGRYEITGADGQTYGYEDGVSTERPVDARPGT